MFWWTRGARGVKIAPSLQKEKGKKVRKERKVRIIGIKHHHPREHRRLAQAVKITSVAGSGSHMLTGIIPRELNPHEPNRPLKRKPRQASKPISCVIGTARITLVV